MDAQLAGTSVKQVSRALAVTVSAFAGRNFNSLGSATACSLVLPAVVYLLPANLSIG